MLHCRLKQMTNDLDKQTDMLRLIVQKMEIRTEAHDWDDDTDDDSSTKADSRRRALTMKGVGWSSATIRHNLLKQSQVVAKWKSFDQH